MLSVALTLGLLALSGVKAIPTTLERRGVTAVSTSTLNSLTDPWATFALVAYCDSSSIKGWKCGDACTTLSGFQLATAGGDDDDVQNYFVGYWPAGKTIVVAHEGTDPTQLESDLTDADIFTTTLPSKYFPSAGSNPYVHEGFLDEWLLTSDTTWAAVQSLVASTGVHDVTCVGHSLGAALSMLECASIRDRSGGSITVHARLFGTPRVGDPNWVTYVDPLIVDMYRVNNDYDLIPIVPGRFLGFQHPHGEVHILSTNNAVSCPGDDDGTDSQCTDTYVGNIANGNIIDHLGPYQGVWIGTIYCT